ncbi:polysaccharide pyruvyl transferase family protein [Pseudomonas sp. CFBP 13710]|uniref:polysaccharide pyruvyl transferase family protein n=1 Tax=Pseudomonas sp. CFBP 13710 TaxID=2775311 RepID=UPI00178716CD|nr:polysaccharide pyruvyl transferase family protein [Pseudomonas sp. CFBP 13710]MBD8729763.1 polysaccharide pyruvyl transferase family protein [Pseudomonas sp. CFBP 13710]
MNNNTATNFKRPKVLATGINPPSANWILRPEDIGTIQPRPDISDWEDLIKATEVNGNTGNYLIGDAGMQALSGCDVDFIPSWHVVFIINNPELLKEFRKKYEKLVIFTANLLRGDYSADTELFMVKKLDLPTVMMSVGIQDRFNLDLPPATVELLDIFKVKNDFIFCRGFESANFLRDRNVNNAHEAGCPSIFAFPEQIKQALMSLSAIDTSRKLNILMSGYLGNQIGTVEDINAISSFSSHISYALQDDHLFYGFDFVPNDKLFYEWNNGLIRGTAKYEFKELEIKQPSYHIFWETDQWREFASTHDVFIGRRFHGGIIAMQAGIPALFLNIDDRMREMLGYAGFPCLEASILQESKNQAGQINEFIDSFDFTEAKKHYEKIEMHFRSLLISAGLG